MLERLDHGGFYRVAQYATSILDIAFGSALVNFTNPFPLIRMYPDAGVPFSEWGGAPRVGSGWWENEGGGVNGQVIVGSQKYAPKALQLNPISLDLNQLADCSVSGGIFRDTAA